MVGNLAVICQRCFDKTPPHLLRACCCLSGLQSLIFFFFYIPPPPPGCPLWGGERSLGLESMGNSRHQRKFLQGTEADLHYDTRVQICGAISHCITWFQTRQILTTYQIQ